MQNINTMVVAALLALFLAPVWAQDDPGTLKILNDGYSMLYSSSAGLQHADKAFLIKFENDATQRVVTNTADYMGELAEQLERLVRDYPSLRIDLQPLPVIEQKKQAAAYMARIKSFAPLIGRTGPDFERTLLLSLSGGINQLRHLARVMAEAERSDARREFLSDAEDRMDGLYAEMLQLLNAQYYTHNTYEPDSE